MKESLKQSFGRNAFWLLTLAFFIGVFLRWLWIFPMHSAGTPLAYMQTYVWSDMYNYWRNATLLRFEHLDAWRATDMMWPLGTSLYLSLVLGPNMDWIAVFQWSQFILAISIPLLTFVFAKMLYGKRAAVISFLIACFTFSLFEASAFALSETPFTVLLLLGSISTLQAKRTDKLLWHALSGLFFGVAGVFKAFGLLIGIAYLLWLLYEKKGGLRSQAINMLMYGGILLLIVGSESVFLTIKNKGHTVFISDDTARIALANHGNLFGVRIKMHDGTIGEIRLPTAFGRGYTEFREITPETRIWRENMTWILHHPAEALRNLVVRVGDLALNFYPFPIAFTRYRMLGVASQIFNLLFILLPSIIALCILPEKKGGTLRHPKTFLIIPGLILLLTAAIAAMEPRYLHPILPMFIILASQWYERVFQVFLPKST